MDFGNFSSIQLFSAYIPTDYIATRSVIGYYSGSGLVAFTRPYGRGIFNARLKFVFKHDELQYDRVHCVFDRILSVFDKC